MRNPFEGSFIRRIDKKIRQEKEESVDTEKPGDAVRDDEIRTYRAERVDEDAEMTQSQDMGSASQEREKLPPVADAYLEDDVEGAATEERYKEDMWNAKIGRPTEHARDIQRDKERRKDKNKRQL